MKKNKLEKIVCDYQIGLIYIFGSRPKIGHELLLKEPRIKASPHVSPQVSYQDIDVGIVFPEFPKSFAVGSHQWD